MPPLMPPTATPKKSSHKTRNIILIIVGIMVIALLAVGGFWYFSHHKSNNKKQAQNTNIKTAPVATNTKHYVSSEQILNLAFDYPNNWQVSPATTTSSGTSNITITSPVTSITSANGQTVPGQVVVSVKPGSSQISELVVNSAVAAQSSAQIAFSNPTPNQLQYPYLSYIHLSSAPNPSGEFEEVMITGGTNFSQGQAVSSADLADVDPVISATFYNCSQNDCSSDNNTLSISNDTWQNSAIFQQVQKLLESFVLN